MTKRMLIDATHAEETRVVVLDGNRLEDFDVETAAKKQLKGNIYLAKVVRVEPSLQAAFVEYGGGRHGFLAFGEIHPDYYQIPVADRQRLLEMQEAEARAEEEAEDAAAEAEARGYAAPEAVPEAEPDEPEPAEMPIIVADVDAGPQPLADVEHAASFLADEPRLPLEEMAEAASPAAAMGAEFVAAREEIIEAEHVQQTGGDAPAELAAVLTDTAVVAPPAMPGELAAVTHQELDGATPSPADDTLAAPDGMPEYAPHAELLPSDDADLDLAPTEPPPETLGGAPAEDSHDDEPREARAPSRFMRSYKIQEVIRRRQILLIQVVKEERGTKGAALTTYVSLAGRFSVLMPNSPRGGGISRKITSAADRRRLKEVMAELQIPRGMGMIVRTAGANRPKAEIKRDCEYLLELWDSIRETTMASIAPALIHEEANLIKRAIRDNYSRDVEEVLVDGEQGWKAARDFMRMLMPAHARKVILWNDPQPLFARQQVEAQLDSMLVPTVQLRSGGYLVINQTEALVAIDVNSGRSTRERGIEETALKTNLEAADEVARQLRLRDLAGLIVIDFIDMESRRNNAAVERRLKDALKDDRARIQIGTISHFGLMEMSRQRLRPSLAETNFVACSHCGGTGMVRSTETSALAVLRAIEDEGAKRRAAEIVVHVAGSVALYVLNHKRVRLAEIESRYGMSVEFAADESLLPPQTRIDRVRAQVPGETPAPLPMPTRAAVESPPEDDLVEEEADERDEDEASPSPAIAETADTAVEGETAEQTSLRKRRRRRRGGRREEGAAPLAAETGDTPAEDPAEADQPTLDLPEGEADAAPVQAGEPGAETDPNGEEARGRRRGRRGGRRRRRDSPEEGEAATAAAPESEGEQASSFDEAEPAPRPAYAGPTPADPFGGTDVFDIFELAEQAEARRAATALAATPAPAADEPGPAMTEASEPEMAALPEAAVAAEPPAVVAAAEPEPAAVTPEPVEAVAPPSVVPEATAVPALVEAEAPLANGHAAPPDAAPMEAVAERAEPVSMPAPPPVLIDGDAPAADKKRGWWRR